MRRLTSQSFSDGRNSMQHTFETVPLWRVAKNFIVIQLSRYVPFVNLKNVMFRTFLGMEVGKDVSVGLMVMLDIMKPQLISIGANSIIGYNTTVLSHEYLIEEFRCGNVKIGSRVLIGANCTILAGIEIGDNAVVAAGTVVTRDVPAGTMVGGNPMRVIRKADMEDSTGT
ncbi:MAG TPA: acyltransferase [Verrucomicrobiae bacterium]|nr:acyltransferase [Verrucomicrobiae bacterium]